ARAGAWPRRRSWRTGPGLLCCRGGRLLLASLVGLGVPLDLDEPTAPVPVIPGLDDPAAGVRAQVKVAPPLCRGPGAGVGRRRGLADVAELGRVTRPAPRVWQQVHSGAPLVRSVADGGRALLADQRPGQEALEPEGSDDLGWLAGGDGLRHGLARHRA